MLIKFFNFTQDYAVKYCTLYIDSIHLIFTSPAPDLHAEEGYKNERP